MFDTHFHDAVVAAARQRAVVLLAQGSSAISGQSHRELMRDAKVLLSLVASGDATAQDRGRHLAAALERLELLHARQSRSGLFVGGDNLESPPDSAFTVNDACDTYEFLSQLRTTRPDRPRNEIDEILEVLAAIIRDVTPPLLTGGVHTPNHRWEISAALARIHRSFPDHRLVERAEEWLSEGVDVDTDGLYSERSPNYAAHVSNPSLSLLAGVLERPELADVVLRNLEATLMLIRPDDTVETVQSRRQDQGAHFPLRDYLAAFRDAAICSGRSDFAAAALRAEGAAVTDPELLAETLLNPRLLEPLPAERQDATGSYFLEAVALAGRRSERTETVLYGGSDYGTQGRIRSGLANNPTFCRLFAGAAILDAVRLSRSFFDLGPFRAQRMRRLKDDSYLLEETLTAAYYQPLAAEDRAATGGYRLEDDGRFSASMAFSSRDRDEVSMRTRIEARLLDQGLVLEVSIDSPELPWSLEFGFRDGGVLEGADRRPDDTWVLPEGRGRYRVGADAISIEVQGAQLSGDPLPYQPGQDYAFLDGTDAVSGIRARVGGMAPAAFTVLLCAEPGTAQ